MKIFISHCSTDAELIKKYEDIFKVDKKTKIFFSSSPETGIKSGGKIMNSLNEEITAADVFVCIITENYVRSAYCIYELNVATYLMNKKRKIIPIVVNENIYSRIKSTIEPLNLLYIDASIEKDFDYRFKDTFISANSERVEQFRKELVNVTTSTRTYVGMDEAFYKGVISYCENHSIKVINNAQEDNDTLISKVKAADEIIILSTTGSALIKKLSTGAFIDALLNKAKIKIIVPNQYSDFLLNVAQLERPNDPLSRFDELAEEYNAAMGYLIEAYQKVKAMKDDIGTIDYYCAFNMLRQTVVLVRKGEDVYGSLSVTIPPMKTIDGTPTIVFDGKNKEGTLPNLLLQHVNSIMGAGITYDGHIEINENSVKKPFFLEKNSVKKYWLKKYEIARDNMVKQDSLSDSILIEVAAQHPLSKDGSPAKEFKARLDRSIELYQKYKSENLEVKMFVPGSLHQYNGVPDKVSLSKSGIDYLIAHGVDKDDIYPEETNYKYKGEDGVYNTADECYVASRIFFDDNFAYLISVCSPNQVARKTILYIEFGVVPLCHCEPVHKMFHNIFNELFSNIEYILYKDHNGQDKTSDLFINSREERKPK